MITTRYLTNKEILNIKFPDLEIIEFDLEFSSTGSILNPPLFNRLCIKKGDEYIFIFPDQYNESIKSKIEEEITKIKEYSELEVFQQASAAVDKTLFPHLIDMFTKANQLINIIYKDQHDKYKADKAKMKSMDAA